MSPIKATPSDPIKRFWDQYIQYLTDKDVKSSVVRWYVIRVEHYIRYYKDKRLGMHEPGDVEKYLDKQGENSKIQDWQFRQIVDAIQNLFAMLNVTWFDKVDWQHWMTSVSLKDRETYIFRRPLPENIPMQPKNGAGSTSFQSVDSR